MDPFLEVSPGLLFELRPRTFLLFYAYLNFERLPGGKHCFASAKTLMNLSGIKDPRVFRKCKQELLSLGLIARVGKGQKRTPIFQTVYSVRGIPVFKGFLFSKELSPSLKVAAICRALKPHWTNEKIGKGLGVSESTAKRAGRLNPMDIGPRWNFVETPGSKTPPKKGQKRTPSKGSFRNLKAISNRDNINKASPVGEEPKPETKRPDDSSFQKSQKDPIGVSELPFWDSTLSREINGTWAVKAKPEVKAQAILESKRREGRGQIRDSVLKYCLGLISQNWEKDYIPTLPRVAEAIRKSKSKLDRLKKAKQLAEKRQLEEDLGREIEAANQAFFDTLSSTQKNQIGPLIAELGNPTGVTFFPPGLVLITAFAHEKFRARVMTFLNTVSSDEFEGSLSP